LPEDEDKIPTVTVKLENLGPATVEFSKLVAQVKALDIAGKAASQNLGQIGLQSAALVNKIQTAQAAALKELGQINFDEKINNAFVLFEKINDAQNRYGVGLQKTIDLQRKVNAAFIGSGRNVQRLTENLISNSRVVDDSKLVQFQKDLSFFTPLNNKSITEQANKLIGLDVALKRPTGAFLGLVGAASKGLATFGESQDVLTKISLQSDLTARQFGVNSDFVLRALDKTFTVQGRITESARFTQLASQIRAATGQDFQFDEAGFRSTDPLRRAKAISGLFQSLSKVGPQLPPGVRRALAAVVSTTQLGQAAGGLGGVQRFLTRPVDTGIVDRGLLAQPSPIGPIRRRAVTLLDQTEIMKRRAAIAQARAEPRLFSSVFPGLGGAISPDATLTGMANQANVLATVLAPQLAKQLAAVAGNVTGVGVAGIGAGLGAAGVETGTTMGTVLAALNRTNNSIQQLVGLLTRALL